MPTAQYSNNHLGMHVRDGRAAFKKCECIAAPEMPLCRRLTARTVTQSHHVCTHRTLRQPGIKQKLGGAQLNNTTIALNRW